MLLKRQEPFEGIGYKTKHVFIRSSYYCRERLIWYVLLACESVGLCPLSWSVREGIRLSHSTDDLVNRSIKINHTHNLHLKMLDFAPFKIGTWMNAYCLRDYFAQTILTNHLLFAIRLYIIHYFTSNRMIVRWNSDFYSSHVIPLNETISYYLFLLANSKFIR